MRLYEFKVADPYSSSLEDIRAIALRSAEEEANQWVEHGEDYPWPEWELQLVGIEDVDSKRIYHFEVHSVGPGGPSI